MRRSIALALALTAAMLSACGQAAEPDTAITGGTVSIQLSDGGITVDGAAASTDESAAVYSAHDIVYYQEGQDFTYGEGTAADAHSQAEAAAHTVVHITRPGTYAVSGTLSAGQIAVDLGEGAEEDPGAVVTLILNGVDITCTVAPAVIFYRVYECGSDDAESASWNVDTSAAGANIVIADGTVNNIAGSYVARIYKPESVELSEDGTEVADTKKLHKYDGAFYSRMSMNVDGGELGDGVLNIDAENEGLDAELHLTINGGIIHIASGNDGINTNEDDISVTTVNGGTLTVQVTGETGEGDGIDSNGWLVINGGTVVSAACSTSGDAGLDASQGICINGGMVAASGNMLDRIDESGQNYAVFAFAERQTGGTACTLKDTEGVIVGEWTPVNDYTYLVVSASDLTAGTYTLWQGETQLAGSVSSGGPGGHGMGGGRVPDGEEPSEGFAPPKGMGPGGPKDRPEDGGQPPHNEGGSIALPDGTIMDPSEMTPPDGEPPFGRPGSGDQDEAGMTVEFTITDGENYFSRVSAAE